MATAQAQLSSGEQQLEQGQEQLDDSKETALEQADLSKKEKSLRIWYLRFCRHRTLVCPLDM